MADLVGAVGQGTTSARFVVFDCGGNETETTALGAVPARWPAHRAHRNA
jgi:glycerol kinase